MTARALMILCASTLTACGRSTPRPVFVEDMDDDRRGAAVARLVAASASHDAAAIAPLLDGEVTYGGLWFADAACRDLAPGRVDGEKLAGCLAPLTLHPSKRAHPYSTVAVLTYEPGIELEVLFDLASAKVKWIGHAGLRASDTLPSVTQEALEALRIDPAPVVLPPEIVAELEAERASWEPRPKQFAAYAWLRVCIDAAGDVTEVQARSASSFRARDVFVGIAGVWRFRPFVLDGQPAPVCSLVAVSHAPASGTGDADPPRFPFPSPAAHPEAIELPAAALGKRTAGSHLIPPDDEDQQEFNRRGYQKIGASLHFCVGADGRVDWIRMTTPSGLERWDAKLTRTLATWRYAPRGEPACSVAKFLYSQNWRRDPS